MASFEDKDLLFFPQTKHKGSDETNVHKRDKTRAVMKEREREIF